MNRAQAQALNAPLTDEQQGTIENMMADLAKADDPVVQDVLKKKPEAARDLCAVVVRMAEAERRKSASSVRVATGWQFDVGSAAVRAGRLPPVERHELDRRMGMPSLEPLVRVVGNRQIFRAGTPEEARGAADARREELAAARGTVLRHYRRQ